jgi:hypothetical protein
MTLQQINELINRGYAALALFVIVFLLAFIVIQRQLHK